MTATLIRPPFYPCRPITGGHYDPAYAPHGDRRYEGKLNGWRALVNPVAGVMFNRHMAPMSIAAGFKEAVTDLELAYPYDEWIDVEALERRHGLLQGCLIVLDLPCNAGNYLHRREIIESNCPVLPFLPGDAGGKLGRVYHLESFQQSEAATMWDAYQEANQLLGVPFYEGLVSKKADSLYPRDTHEKEFKGWIKYRFIQG